MDTESLKRLIRAAVLAAPLAAPLSACGGAEAPPSRPVVNLDPPPAPAEPERENTAGTETHARSTDGTMDPEEFDRQWRQGTGGDGSEPEPQIMIMEGRPLMASDGPVRASLRDGAGWGHAEVFRPLPRAASRWLDAALAEHASVASFARSVMELSALGAPAELLEGHLSAGLDEVRHARLSFEIAARFGAQHQVPGPMAVPSVREASFAQLAVDTFVEGCINETIAALVATRAAARCQDPVIVATLEAIADDEARHAALAWRTVRWALEADPAPVRARLEGVALPAAEGGDHDPELATYGLLDTLGANCAARDAVDRVIAPLRVELLG